MVFTSQDEINSTDDMREDAAYPQPVRVFVVLNPVAGTSKPDTVMQVISRYCEQHNWDCEIYQTHKDEDLRHLVHKTVKKGVDMVIVAGGDGTVSAVAAGMINSQIPLGVLPVGTGNALARDRLIPLDLNAALALLGGDHQVQALDAMEVVGKGMYVLNVSVGVSSITMRMTAREEKRRYGFLAYIYRAARSIMRSDLHRFKVKVDDFPIRFSASEVFIANCKLAGFQPLVDGVEVVPDDNRLDMFIIRARSIRDYLGVLARFIIRGGKKQADNLYYAAAQESIVIESEITLPVQADGEELGTTPVEIRVIPNALKLIVPCSVKVAAA